MSATARKIIKNVQEVKIKCTGEGWQKRNSACNRIIAAGKEDIRFKVNNFQGKNKVTIYGIVCPLCGCFTRIPTEKLPTQFITNAEVLQTY